MFGRRHRPTDGNNTDKDSNSSNNHNNNALPATGVVVVTGSVVDCSVAADAGRGG